MRIDPAEIMRIMPHGHPMCLVDGARIIGKEKYAIAYKNISLTERCYEDVASPACMEELAYPVSLMIESFAQGAGILLDKSGFLSDTQSSQVVVFGSFRDIEVTGMVFPGEQMQHHVQLDYIGHGMAELSGSSLVDDRVVMRCGSLQAFRVRGRTLTENRG